MVNFPTDRFNSLFSFTAQQAIAQCVQDARNFAKNLSGPERKEIMDLADDVERLSKKLADLKKQGKVSKWSQNRQLSAGTLSSFC